MPQETEALYEPISLGYSCETKYQISRITKGQLYPKQSEMAFRYAIRQPDHASSFYSWRLFDWQNTPLETVCDYIERDFKGIFELEDLEVTFDYGVPAEGGVLNRRFGTVYIHEFFPADPGLGVTTQAQIETYYPSARQTFARLVDDFRGHLTLPGPYLYTIAHPSYPDAATLDRLIGLLSSRSPEHRFKILVVGREGHDSDLSCIADRVIKAWRRPADPEMKAPHLAWEGDDASWDKALAPFRLGLHPEGFHDLGAPRSEHVPIPASRAAQTNFPPSEAAVVWERGPDAVYTNNFWRNAGAELRSDEAGAVLTTPAVAWHYSHAVDLELAPIDFERHQVWLRVVLEDVSGGPLLAALFDKENNTLADEVLADQGAGPFEMFLKVRDARKTMLLFRTGDRAESACARLTEVDLLQGPRLG